MFNKTSARASAFIDEMHRQEYVLIHKEAKTEEEISALANLFLFGDIAGANTLLSMRYFELIRPLRLLKTVREGGLYIALGKKPFDITTYALGSDFLSPDIDLPKETDLNEELVWARDTQENPKLSIDDVIKERVVEVLVSINRIDANLKRKVVPYQEIFLYKGSRSTRRGLSFVAWTEKNA